MQSNLKQAWEIVTKPGVDDKTKLQALALISECEKNIMDLVTNGVYVTNALAVYKTSSIN
jgi:hypothetical protein